MGLEGELKSLALPKVLQSIASQRSSGILTVQGDEDIVAVSFLHGGIVAADALNQTVEEGLGDVLQGRGLITPEAFAEAVREHQGGGSGSLVDLLIHRGVVGRDDLLEGLRLQTYRLMLQILTWRQGEFKFYAGDEISYEDGFSPISVDELLIRSIEDLGENGGFAGPVPDLEAAYRRVPSRGAVKVMGRDGDGLEEGTWISQEQEAFMGRVSPETSASAAAAEVGLSRYQALFALYNLLHQDLVEHVGEPKPAAAPAAAPAEEPQDLLDLEILTPPEPGVPEPAPVPAPEMRTPARPSAGIVQKWIGPFLGAAFAAILAVALSVSPGAFLLPFPWQDTLRGSVERQLRQTLYLKIDRAAKTYFLTQVHYPNNLDELAALGLVSPADLEDQAGQELVYSTDDMRSYRIVPHREGEPAVAEATLEEITGDFLLDPAFLRPTATDVPPLYLLD